MFKTRLLGQVTPAWKEERVNDALNQALEQSIDEQRKARLAARQAEANPAKVEVILQDIRRRRGSIERRKGKEYYKTYIGSIRIGPQR